MTNEQRKREFPNDKRTIVTREDLTTYKTWESENLMRVHKWQASEVRIAQDIRVNPRG